MNEEKNIREAKLNEEKLEEVSGGAENPAETALNLHDEDGEGANLPNVPQGNLQSDRFM